MATHTGFSPVHNRDIDALPLRERKKIQTGIKIWRTAIGLFAAKGFDQVSVAEIAAAAEISKMTVFNYFPTKEDLVMAPMEQHLGEPARVVRERAPGASAVTALREHYLAALAAFDPATGLNDDQVVLDVVRLVHHTPALAMRATAGFGREAQAQLTAELLAQDPAHDEFVARVAGAQLLATRLTLTTENQVRMLAGECAADALPEALDRARRAFDLVERGLGDYCADTP
ncbi:TetR/AcrR family transcriptional regulator [Kitasatospora aureofaciens]|uniref:TetR/AcrR family transcriptional regulator n=1 Tax=Kitasatospora aureofaciens TaxID=1894 RepID=UPI001C484EA7|nr:TetR family transcriptional regulator [Kitasatospora aureofaciens]MBV6697637.1 TetR family transcriptional regulator [Kitasatospora aureofaciens]